MLKGVYKTRVIRDNEVIAEEDVFNVITNEARELIALAMFDGATTPTAYQIGLIGTVHNEFGAPRMNIADPLGPPFLTANPIYNDIFSMSGLQIDATATYADLGSTNLPTLDTSYARTAWSFDPPTVNTDNRFQVAGNSFITYSVPSDTAVYGFYLIGLSPNILVSVAPFSWVRAVPRQPFGTRPNGGGGFNDIQWNTGNGPLIEGDVLEVVYSLGSEV